MADVLEKQGWAHLGCNSPAIRFKALVRASTAGFPLLSGLFNRSSAFYIAGQYLSVLRTCEV